MVRQGNELKEVPSAPPLFNQRHEVDMNTTLGAPFLIAEVTMPLSARQAEILVK